MNQLQPQLNECISNHPIQYESMKTKFLDLNTGSKEIDFLKYLLQLKKLQSPKLPSKAFTLYKNTEHSKNI